MQPTHDAAFFAVVVCLPLVARLLMVPRIGEPVRAVSISLGERLWVHLVDREEPDEHQLRRWALTRLDELERHLARVRDLVADDEGMSATRQLANRFAYERLKVDVAAAAAGAPDRSDVPAGVCWRPPAEAVRYLPAPPATRAGTVEIIELGPAGRWF